MKCLARTLSLLMAAALLLSAVGCSPAPASTGPTTGDATTATTTVPAGPVKVTLFVNKGNAMDADSSDDLKKQLHDYYLETCNVDFNYIMPPMEKEEEKLNLLLTSSGTEINAFWGDWPKYSSKRIIRTITDLYDPALYPGIEQEFAPMNSPSLDASGNLWGLPRFFATAPYPYEWRVDYAESLGLPNPLTGPATLEELNAYLYAFRDKDPAGSGNTIPLVSRGINYMAFCLLGGYTEFGNYPWLDSADNLVKLPVAQPGYKDFISQLTQWYADGILYKEFYTLDTAALRELAASGRAASALDWYTAWGNGFARIWEADKSTTAVGGITHKLTGPEGSCEYATKASTRSLVFTANTTDEQVSAILRMFDHQCQNREAFYDAANGPGGWEYTDKANGLIHVKTKEELPSGWQFFNAFDITQGLIVVDQYTHSVQNDDPLYNQTGGATGNPFSLYIYAFQCYPPVEYLPKPFDYDIPFDTVAISEDVPQMSDIERMIDEQLIKFVIGERDLSQWDGFISELYSAGMGEVEKAYTAQYESFKK